MPKAENRTESNRRQIRSIRDKGYIVNGTYAEVRGWVRGPDRIRGLEQRPEIRGLIEKYKWQSNPSWHSIAFSLIVNQPLR